MAKSNLEALKGINAYPIPMRTLDEIAERRGVNLMATATQESLKSKEYKLAKADLLLWLAFAPNISQGGQSYSFTDEQRNDMKREARGIYAILEPEANATTVTYGYKGDRL
ncbi:MAG: hypothetical protein HDS59_00295 [Barnesiella sp.]|nr:hypothetical protein [Barnesiella sp.]